MYVPPKNKRCEGYDCIPVCISADARENLLDPMAQLFSKIYTTRTLPEQWKISKIIPIFKKGDRTKIENYRPIANLCSGSKNFEKLILKQIHEGFFLGSFKDLVCKSIFEKKVVNQYLGFQYTISITMMETLTTEVVSNDPSLLKRIYVTTR